MWLVNLIVFMQKLGQFIVAVILLVPTLLLLLFVIDESPTGTREPELSREGDDHPSSSREES